jgi:hypothetical protein
MNKPTHLTPLLWPQIGKAKHYVRKSNTTQVGVSVDRLVVLTAKFQVRVSVWLPVILFDNLPGFPWDIGDKTVKMTITLLRYSSIFEYFNSILRNHSTAAVQNNSQMSTRIGQMSLKQI